MNNVIKILFLSILAFGCGKDIVTTNHLGTQNQLQAPKEVKMDETEGRIEERLNRVKSLANSMQQKGVHLQDRPNNHLPQEVRNLPRYPKLAPKHIVDQVKELEAISKTRLLRSDEKRKLKDLHALFRMYYEKENPDYRLPGENQTNWEHRKGLERSEELQQEYFGIPTRKQKLLDQYSGKGNNKPRRRHFKEMDPEDVKNVLKELSSKENRAKAQEMQGRLNEDFEVHREGDLLTLKKRKKIQGQ